MQFVSIREFRNSTREVWERIEQEEEVVITVNGKPKAILLNIPDDDFGLIYDCVRRAKKLHFLFKQHSETQELGYINDEVIHLEIKAARREMREAEERNNDAMRKVAP